MYAYPYIPKTKCTHTKVLINITKCGFFKGRKIPLKEYSFFAMSDR
jgi:hypothetical protein